MISIGGFTIVLSILTSIINTQHIVGVVPIFIYFKVFIGVWLIYGVVLVPGAQQSESVIHISTLLDSFPI